MVAIFDGLSGKTLKEIKLPKNANINQEFSGTEFSPNGEKLLVSIQKDRKLLVYDSNGFTLKETWENKESKSLEKAKWVDDTNILASFGAPFSLVLYEIGQRSPLRVIAPKEASGDLIRAFCFCQDGSRIYCGSFYGLVFKMPIGQSRNEIIWKNETSKNAIGALCVTKNEKYLCASVLPTKLS